MKTFRELYLHLNGASIEEIGASLTRHCRSPWRRCEDKENDLGLSGRKPLCFESQGGGEISPAALFLFPKKDDVWNVSNIVPTKESELGPKKYNLVLENFLANVVTPAIAGTSATVEVSSDEISIGSVAGTEVERALVSFSNLANKSTGSSHPSDRERWFEFLILASEAEPSPDTELVINTLIELGWSEEKAYDLGLRYEFANGLLSYARER